MRLRQPYRELPDLLYAEADPTPVLAPSWIAKNHSLASALGISPDWLDSDEALALLSGQHALASPKPLAMAYAGHQFGHWVPLLGDGRALLLGEHTDRDGRRWEIQLKGAGATPFSRNGDGRSSIGPVVREYLASEAMAALGIPTTRSLAAIATGESVQRQTAEAGGILVRVARSHVRIGTFEYAARLGEPSLVEQLLDYVITQHHPDLIDAPQRALFWYQRVIENTAKLISQWMQVGFIHGVMNTDNMSVMGDTLDYGPFGFLDTFAPETVYSSIDQGGRYAYHQQPAVATWNLARLAECLLPLLASSNELSVELAKDALGRFPGIYKSHFDQGVTEKVGLDPTHDQHRSIALDFLDLMATNDADMTLAFRGLASLTDTSSEQDKAFKLLFDDPAAVDAWLDRWRMASHSLGEDAIVQANRIKQTNPAFILRNHLAQRAVDAAVHHQDFGPMHRLLSILSRPYDDQPDQAQWAGPPAADERVLTTFCGT